MEDNFGIFDEEDAIKFIKNDLPENIKSKYDDEDYINLIDIIWEYYEKKGYLDINLSEEDDDGVNIEDLIKYVKKEVAKADYLKIDETDIPDIVKSEIKYEETLDDIL